MTSQRKEREHPGTPRVRAYRPDPRSTVIDSRSIPHRRKPGQARVRPVMREEIGHEFYDRLIIGGYPIWVVENPDTGEVTEYVRIKSASIRKTTIRMSTALTLVAGGKKVWLWDGERFQLITDVEQLVERKALISSRRREIAWAATCATGRGLLWTGKWTLKIAGGLTVLCLGVSVLAIGALALLAGVAAVIAVPAAAAVILGILSSIGGGDDKKLPPPSS